MQFAVPSLLAVLALVPVYVWLRLRQRRPPVAVVSSLLLWKAVPPAPLEALARRERLWNLVLLIEGLSLALVCAALARPFGIQETTRPVHLVLGVDDSASLRAGDRWKRLEARAREFIRGLEDKDLVTLLTGTEERPRLTPRQALAALLEFAPRAAEDDIEGLLVRARALAAGEEGAVARVLTDRTILDAPEVESLGGPVDNAGILDASYDGEEVFVLVASTSPRRLRVEAFAPPFVLPYVEVDVVDQRPAPVVLPVKANSGFTLRLSLGDDLHLDDEVRLEMTPKIRVRIETPGNPDLVRALSIQPGVEVVQGGSSGADLVVLDRTWPGEPSHLPYGIPRVLIAPPEGCPFRGKELKGPISWWHATHPLTEGLDPVAVGLIRGFAVDRGGGIPNASWEILASVEGLPVVATLGELNVDPEVAHLLYIGFDVSASGGESTWSTHPHFPVFWNRVVKMLASQGRGTWTRSGLCSRKETLCAGSSTPTRPVDFARTRVVSSPRFFAAHALAAAALGFSLAFLLSRRANGWRSSLSSTTR